MGYTISKEEIEELHRDGKIGPEEYKAMLNERSASLKEDKCTAWSGLKRKIGRIALLLLLLGIITPLLCFGIQEKMARIRDIESSSPTPGGRYQYHWIAEHQLKHWFLILVVVELSALTLGVCSFPDRLGKKVVISSLLILTMVFALAVILTQSGVLPYNVYPPGHGPRSSSVMQEKVNTLINNTAPG